MKRVATILVLLVFSYWTIQPLLGRGFFPMHDDTQVGRVIEMGRALRNGQFPVRWVSDLGYGYGYPLFNFYGPLPYYVGGFLYSVGIDALIATKAMFALGIVLSGITMYFLVSSFFGRSAGLVSGVFYLYAPYHAVDIYVRGAVGEFWAIGFLPLVLYGFIKTQETKHNLGWLVGGLGLSGVILSHTILGYITVIFVTFGIICYSLIRWTLVKNMFFLVLTGLGLSAFFWLPAIWEMGATNVVSQIGGTADFKNHFVCISQLWNSPWGFGGSVPGCTDGLSFRLGKLSIIMALVSFMLFLIKQLDGKARGAVFGGLAMVVGSVFFMTGISERLWEIIPGFSYIQYPWRFLSYAIFGLSLMSGVVVALIRPRILRLVITLVLCAAAVFFYAKLFTPQYLYDREMRAFESDNDLRWRVSKISDEYLPPGLQKPTRAEDVQLVSIQNPDGFTIETEIDTETYTKAFIAGSRDGEVIINRAVFPGWHYFVDGQEVRANIQNGLPHLFIPHGSHVLEVAFTNTSVRFWANMATAFTLVAIFGLVSRRI